MVLLRSNLPVKCLLKTFLEMWKRHINGSESKVEGFKCYTLDYVM